MVHELSALGWSLTALRVELVLSLHYLDAFMFPLSASLWSSRAICKIDEVRELLSDLLQSFRYFHLADRSVPAPHDLLILS